MDNLKILLESGADIVAGAVIANHQILGMLRDGDVHLTDDGRKYMEALDTALVTPDSAEAKAPKKHGKKPARIVETSGSAIEAAVPAQVEDTTSDLLAQLEQDGA